ncbi:NERD domain-containing protein [Sphaerisporangium sp. TRM90804]|uniref:NERD domain-containing protein n=1 Tax=Sphaerisporangium sp. TRM90804 TaxID=3031113 RepID=UPI0024479F59|nr:NERD domain-containing protein [Sphaerisporangium sp. TRM90804]MDH2427439.1 NERD domain-containing protein [Sphaerisporangium sp. TRM90804]
MPNGSIYVPPNDKYKWGTPSVMYELRWRETRPERRRRRHVMAVAGALLFLAFAFYRTLPMPFLVGLLGGAAVWAGDAIVSWRMFEATAVWRGKRSGAVRTGRVLRRRLRRQGYRVLDGRAVPGKASIDHLVIGPGGVWVVDNEAWAPDTDIAAYGGKLFLGERSGSTVAAALVDVAHSMTELLSRESGIPIEAYPVLVVHGGRLRTGMLTAEGMTLLTPRKAAAWILGDAHAELDEEHVELLARTAARILRRM